MTKPLLGKSPSSSRPRVRWAETIASLLVPGGVFYFADAYPAILVL